LESVGTEAEPLKCSTIAAKQMRTCLIHCPKSTETKDAERAAIENLWQNLVRWWALAGTAELLSQDERLV